MHRNSVDLWLEHAYRTPKPQEIESSTTASTQESSSMAGSSATNNLTSGSAIFKQQSTTELPLIKYYSFLYHREKNTCYEGKYGLVCWQNKETKEKEKKPLVRQYPDEYLIAHILDKYLAAHPQPTAHQKIIILIEPWEKNGGTREGSSNTSAINTQILTAIDAHVQLEDKEQNTLILVPFLYGFHHPSIAIDIKNKVAIYLDPKGWLFTSYPETIALQQAILAKEGFSFIEVKVAQQVEEDLTSCGPVLTSSFIMLIEEFKKFNKITAEGFTSNKTNLATDRMFQMYLNNAVESPRSGFCVQEIMMADEDLWEEFLVEQAIDKSASNLIFAAIGSLRSYIESPHGSIDPQKIQLISLFQSRMIEKVLLQPNELDVIKSLARVGLNLLKNTVEEGLNLLSTPPLLMQREAFELLQNKNKLGLYKEQGNLQEVAEIFSADEENHFTQSNSVSAVNWLSMLSTLPLKNVIAGILIIGGVAAIMGGSLGVASVAVTITGVVSVTTGAGLLLLEGLFAKCRNHPPANNIVSRSPVSFQPSG